MRGRLFETRKPGWKDTTLLETPEQAASILQDVFGLAEPNLQRLWPMICKRHNQMFPHAEGGRLA